MKPARFEYTAPRGLDEALALLAPHDDGQKICSGSQSLGPMLNLRLAQPSALVDVSRIPALREHAVAGSESRIGAAVTHADIEDGRVADVTGGLLRFVAGGIAYRAVRNRGTLGGSLAHADPAADWVSTMTLLGASLHLQSLDSARTVPVDDFFEGPFTTVLGPGELLAAVTIPAFSKNAKWSYRKTCRKPGEFADAIVGVWIDPAQSVARLVLGALDRMPIALDGAGTLAALRKPEALEQALDKVGLDDPYRRQLLRVLVRRSIESIDIFPQ
jgi:aerobic carbon-monoxide dehydrogenase medium subunit